MRYGDTSRALENLTDDRGFEKLGTLLLSRTGINVRPVGGSGDRGRDALVGLFRGDGEDTAAAISLQEDWPAKLRADLRRMASHGLRHEAVIFITNRSASPTRQKELQEWATEAHGVDLTVLDQRWLVARLYRRENLDLRREFLGLEPPRPHLFLDLGEYEDLLAGRQLLDAQRAGREVEMSSLERRLAEGNSVVLEAPGGFGKTRLVFELASSGESATPWFFVDAGLPFDLDFVAEAEDGYEVTVFVDDAHRRTDLGALLGGLERRVPRPRLVFAVRPGHVSAVETAMDGLGFPALVSMPVGILGRGDLATVLRSEPFNIERDAMIGRIIALSEGNVGVAVLAARLAVEGSDPGDLSQAGIFRTHVDSRLRGAGLQAREARELLAVVAAAGGLDATDRDDLRGAEEVTGLGHAELRRKLNEFADVGLVVEDPADHYAVKPDVVREHVQRFSFFPETGRALLRYERVYNAFSHRLEALLNALGESRPETAPSAASALGPVRRDLQRLLRTAQTPGEVIQVAALAVRLGKGASALTLEIAEGLLDKLDDLPDAQADRLASLLVELLAVAKFGRDRFPQAWRQLLVLSGRVFARPALTGARQAAEKEISEVFSSAPMNYSEHDVEILGYIQNVVQAESRRWWADEQREPGAAEVGALLVEPAFTLQLEQHRQAADNAMAINLVAGFVPAWRWTDELLRFGADLFEQTFSQLGPLEQLAQLERLERLAHVASGYPGVFSTVPSDDLQRLCEDVLVGVERWLSDHLGEMSLPVAAKALSQLRQRRYRVGGKRARRRVALPRPSGDLRSYLDLVDSHWQWVDLRRDWQKQQEEARDRGARYGLKLAKARDPVEMLDKWNSWVDDCEAAGQSVDHVPLVAAFGALAESNLALARTLVETVVERSLSIGRFTDDLLNALVQEEENWELVERWAADPEPDVRRFAAASIPRAPTELANRLLAVLASDSDEVIRAIVWRGLVYFSGEPLAGSRLDLVLQLTRSSTSPLELLGQLLGRLRHQVEDRPTRSRLSATQRKTLREVILESAHLEDSPRNQRLKLVLEEALDLGVDLVLPWLRERLTYIKDGDVAQYTLPLPDELQPLLYARRERKAARVEVERLLNELEDDRTTGLYRLAVEQAVDWLGADSAAVTTRMATWAGGRGRQRELAYHYVHSGNWRTFTKRARLLLDAQGDSADVRQALIGDRFPNRFGDLEPYLLARANDYRRWLNHHDGRLREIAKEAIAYLEQAAEDEAERERRVREVI